MATELNFHQDVAAALERGVQTRDWFLWLSVEPPESADADELPPLEELADQVQQWLSGLDPDQVGGKTEGTRLELDREQRDRGCARRGDPEEAGG